MEEKKVQWDSNQVCCHYKKQRFFLNTTEGYLQAASATGKTACLDSVYRHKQSSFSISQQEKEKQNGIKRGQGPALKQGGKKT